MVMIITTLENRWIQNLKSRKSTHKRQKQYFEQRKRLLQEKGDSAVGKHPPSLNWECNGSLDVLCLENLSNLAQESKINTPTDVGMEEDHDFTFNHYCAQHNSEDSPIKQSDIPPAERTSFRNVAETEYLKSSSASCSTERNGNAAGDKGKCFPCDLSIQQEISLFDLVGDETVADKGEIHSPDNNQEIHVSFTLEGLGKVGSTTPLRSPKTPGRSYSTSRCSPLAKIGGVDGFLRLDHGFDDITSGLEMDSSSVYGSSSSREEEELFCSWGMMKKRRSPPDFHLPKLQTIRNFSPWNDTSSADDVISDFSGTTATVRGRCNGIVDDFDDSLEESMFRDHQQLFGRDAIMWKPPDFVVEDDERLVMIMMNK
ncbi:hypothetical protein M569_12867 [Genlisea aurea]|uniref:Uncharacterized protein n=1 Tax=Genlisea aurea TaxID=192259 RepID=S8DGM0_9LAMI|nr:hypothetical protein M569_12867 [Genlisea aurea]